MFSHGEEVVTHLRSHRLKTRLAAILYVVVALSYLVWRPSIFHPDAWCFSLLFYFATLYGIVLGILLLRSCLNTGCRGPAPKDYRPSVDVFVPVYTEPADMIELTVIGAKSIDYPHETFLLDDGRRPELREIAERHGVRYITRADNAGAKAGNMNNALKFSTAEVIAVFDADHIATRESLDTLVGFLKDPAVGMVQAPQTFYNEDSFLYRNVIVGGGRWHEQLYFMDVLQSARDLSDGTTGVGTGVVYRRSSIAALGGFPEATLTEDLHISLMMHKRRMKTVWVNENVAWGVAAADVAEYYKTRRRWTYGNLQSCAIEQILWCPGLRWQHRLAYAGRALNLLSGWQQLFFIVMPLYCLLTLSTPFVPSLPNMSVVVFTQLVLMWLLQIASAGYIRFVPSQIFSMGIMFVQIAATQGLLGKKMVWQTSLKNVLGKVSPGKLLLHVLLLVISVLAISLSILFATRVIAHPGMNEERSIMLYMSTLWVGFNCWRSWRWISDSVRLTRRTHREYLFEVKLPVRDEHGAWVANTVRLSTQQCEVRWLVPETQREPGQPLQVLIPGHTIHLRVDVVDGNMMEITCADETSRDLLRRSLYSVDWHRQIRLCKHMRATRLKGLGGDWQPVIIHDVGRQDATWALWLPAPAGFQQDRLMVAADYPSGQILEIEHRTKGRSARQRHVVGNEIIPHRFVPRGMNNNHFHFYEMALAESP